MFSIISFRLCLNIFLRLLRQSSHCGVSPFLQSLSLTPFFWLATPVNPQSTLIVPMSALKPFLLVCELYRQYTHIKFHAIYQVCYLHIQNLSIEDTITFSYSIIHYTIVCQVYKDILFSCQDPKGKRPFTC